MEVSENQEGNELLAAAMRTIIRILLENGNNVAQADVFVDGYFFKMRIKIERIVE